MEVVASLSQDRTAAAQCGLFTHKSVPVKFEPPCRRSYTGRNVISRVTSASCSVCFGTDLETDRFPFKMSQQLNKSLRTKVIYPKNGRASVK